jgi:PBP1b-binding outer membrane lipoprotein LpoB
MMKTLYISAAALMMFSGACSQKTPAPKAAVKKTVRPPAPTGPTRTDFKTIAKKLLSRCVAGGWIERWRSTAPDVDVAKPRIRLLGFENKTKQDFDPSYLQSVLARRMRMSGVYEMVAESAERDFDARGRLLRMYERMGGKKISVYTAILDIISPSDGKIAYSCEASVRGEM